MENTCIRHDEIKIQSGSKLKCRSCNREYQRKWFNENKETQRKRVGRNNKIYQERNARYIFEFLKQNPCVECGEDDPLVLQFDHQDPTNKKAGVSKLIMSSNSLETLQTEMDKCDVLCAHCHIRKTAKQFGWRKLMWLKEL